MRVLFLQTVPSVAEAGQVKEVKNGYARNYLLPKKLAALATPDELQRVDALRKAEAERQMKTMEEFAGLAQRLESTKITIKSRVGVNGQLYGSVTNSHIADELSRILEIDVDRRKVVLEEPLKRVGTYEVPVNLSHDVVPIVKVEITDQESGPEAEQEQEA